MKRLFTMLLSCLMVVGAALPAMAADSDMQKEYTVTSTIEEPSILVTMPAATGQIVLNPYGMTVTQQGDATNQIIFAPQYIKNESSVPMDLSVSATTTVSGGASLVSTSLKEKSNSNKQMFLYTSFETASSNSEAVQFGAYSANDNQLLLKSGTVTKTVLKDIPKGSEAENYIFFQINGDMTPNPTTAWGANDKVTVKLVFKFIPKQISASNAG